MTTTEIDRTSSTERERLLDEAALQGLDLTAARGRVEVLARGRRRTVRRSLGALCASALVLLGGLVLLDGEDPEEVVADRADPTTTTTTASTTTTTLPAAAPTTSAPVVATTAAPTTVAPTTTTVTTTTVPPNQSMVARVRVLDPQVQAGQVAAVEIDWVDPDHAGTAPEVVADWGDPLVAAADQPAPAPAGACDAPGDSGGGVVRREFRYASPGVHTVRFTLSTCGAEGAYAERVGVEATVTVTDASIDGASAQTLVAVSPRTASGLPVLPALDAATAVVVPDDPGAPEVRIESRTPLLGQFATSGPATVLRVPAGTVGTLRLTWPNSACTSSAAIDLTTATDDVALVALESSC